MAILQSAALSNRLFWLPRCGANSAGRHAGHALPFPKCEDPDRLVCFCFVHAVRDITADVLAHGESRIQASITEACRRGADDCKRKNPEGRCCLGNVAAVIRAAGGDLASSDVAGGGSEGACCASEAPQELAKDTPSPTRAVALGAVGAAALSSACCWLPLLLMALGLSSAGAGAFFEAWRVPLLAATVSLLGFGFYLVYFRERACEPGDTCASSGPSTSRRNRALLWFSSIAVAAFAFFPEYVTALTGDGISTAAQATPAQITVVYTIDGMTCGGCASHAKTALEKISGVASASVSYELGEAKVVWSAPPEEARVASALGELGYRAWKSRE